MRKIPFPDYPEISEIDADAVPTGTRFLFTTRIGEKKFWRLAEKPSQRDTMRFRIERDVTEWKQDAEI